MLVRDIIDIDSTYEDFEASNDEEEKNKKEAQKKTELKERSGRPRENNADLPACPDSPKPFPT